MHAPRFVVAISLASVLAACSKPKTHEDAALARDLDLALSTGSRAVVSSVELGAKPAPKAKAPAAPSPARQVKRPAASARPSVKETAPVPEPIKVEPAPVEQTVAVAPAPVPTVTVTQAPVPGDTQPVSEPQRGGNGGRGFPGGDGGVMRIPGIGGVIILRGGGGGLDPCDERDHHGRGGMMGGMGGGILMNPRAPTMPGRMIGGWGRFAR